jgi:3-oxoacyl-[acyl-carrier-protein] synthase II
VLRGRREDVHPGLNPGNPRTARRLGDADVVISGVGLRCAAGSEPPVRPFVAADAAATALGVRAVARVKGVGDLPGWAGDRKAALAFAAAADALASARFARIQPPDLASGARVDLGGARAGVFLGTGLSSLTPAEFAEDLVPHLRDRTIDRDALARDLAIDRASPRCHDPACVSRHLAAAVGAPLDAAETHFSACAAAAMAIGSAARAVARGDVDLAITGGHDSMIHPLGILSFVVLGALAPAAGRPFDRRRDGFLLGEGSGCFVLERASDARARGATILGRVLGCGTSIDAWNVTAPHPEGHGAALAMQRALDDAGLCRGEIDYVNAHGTGTPVGDRAEAKAIAAVLGDVPVSSFKGSVGHAIAAAGAVELALCLPCFLTGTIPGTAGLQDLDPDCPAQVLTEAISRRVRALVSNSFGFGGQNCALVIGAP